MIRLLTIESTKESWFTELTSLYTKKIKPFYPFERLAIKSKTHSRAQAEEKIKVESTSLIEKSEGHYLVLLDERGKSHSSEEFAKNLINIIESGHKNIDFIIGGAFGVNDELKQKANQSICLAPFVMNHLIAQAVLMEQVYRSFTIWKGLPYHNH